MRVGVESDERRQLPTGDDVIYGVCILDKTLLITNWSSDWNCCDGPILNVFVTIHDEYLNTYKVPSSKIALNFGEG